MIRFFVRALATVLLLLVLAPTTQADTHQTVPSANFSFIPDLQNFLRVEDANRESDIHSSVVVSGGIHSTAGGLVGSPSTLTAYLGGFYTTESGTITYPDASTCHVIAHKDTVGNQGSYTRVSGTHYLINCASSIPPTIPDVNSTFLMTVTTSGGAITAVTDRRALGNALGFDACRYSTLNAAIAAIGTSPAPIYVRCFLRATTDVTIPSTTAVRVSGAGQLCPDAGVTLTIAAAIEGTVRQTFCTTGTITFSGQANPVVWDGWFPATEAGLQSAVNSLVSNQTLYCSRDRTLATGIIITNKSGIRITGRCALTLSNISGTSFIFQLVGTLDRIEIDSLELIGVANVSAHQEGIGNLSGQTITNTKFHDLTIHDLNVGIECNADGAGTYTRCEVYRNSISNIVGTSPGQGYGIVLSNTNAAAIFDNRINLAQRHSIYHGKSTQSGGIIAHNIITNHRQGVATVSRTGALVVVRSSGVHVDNNIILNHFDGCLDISHDTAQAADAYDIQVTNNACLYRQNAVDDLYVGELLVPTNSRTYRISITGNIFRSDYAQASNTSDVFIYNGTSITYKNNEHYRTGTTAATNTYILELGHNSAIGTSADFDDVVLENNRFVVTGSNLSSARCIQIESDITTGTSVVRTAHNDFVGCPTTHYLVSASTNPGLVLDYGPGTKVSYYTPADTTPTVKYGVAALDITNSGAITITNLDDGIEGQIVRLRFADSNTTIQDGGNFQLSGGVNFTPTANDMLTVISRGSVWYEISRSAN